MGDGVRTEQLTAALLAIALLALGSVARAEPYLAVRFGAKCSDCHTNLDGGGKRTSFATIHAHDILHDLQILPLPKGVQSFNGEINQRISIGSDLRPRSTTTFADTPNAQGRVPENRAFRDHVDNESLTVQEANGYLQVDLWPEVLTLYGDFNAAGGGVTAREALAIVHLPFNSFLKAGRFFPPFGLRLYEDASFVRQASGFTFQNPDEGVEMGIQPGPLYLAAAVTNGAPGDKDVLSTVNAYTVFEDIPILRNLMTGGSFARQSNERNVSAFYGGSNFWQFTYLGEFDLIDDRTQLPANTGRDQYASYAEIDWLLFKLVQPPRHLRLPEGLRQSQPDALPDRGRAVHRQVHPAAPLLRHQQRPGERAAAEHHRDRLRAPLLLLDGPPPTSPTPPRSRSGRPARPSGPPP